MSALLIVLAAGFGLIWIVGGLTSAALALVGWVLGIIVVSGALYVWDRL